MLLMELCTEGSLQKMLSEPQHVFGLHEILFVSFFTQFGLFYLYLAIHQSRERRKMVVVVV